jgi:hypothetical protein
MSARTAQHDVVEVARARRWFSLAVLSLFAAGVLALALVVGRLPGLGSLVADPLMFRRALVLHVDLALVVWLLAFVAGLFSLLPTSGRPTRRAAVAPWVACAGLAGLFAAVFAPGAEPVLSNYVPMIDHPLFAAGLIAFGLGIATTLVDGRLLPGREVEGRERALPEAARPGLRVAAVTVLAALLTFFGTWLSTPTALEPKAYYEVLFWGGGHLLQVATTAAMVAVWLMLLTPTLGHPPISRRVSALLFGWLAVPALVSPVLLAYGPTSATYREGFTDLMRWGIFPPVTVFLLLTLRALFAAWRTGRLERGALGDPRVLGFFSSAGLAVLGFVLGALIRGSNTMVPAHYHAAIGAVTASFMTASFVLFAPLGVRFHSPRAETLSRFQALIFGVGQAVFALGFAIAGAHGMARKTYASEQVTHSVAHTVGLWVMGLGGLVAVVGGVLYLYITLGAGQASRPARRASHQSSRSERWTRSRSIPFRS